MSVKKPTSSQKVGVVAGVLVGGSALAWLLSQAKPADLMGRFGMACALFCISSVFAASWAAIVAYVGHIRSWTPRSCFLAGALSLLIVGSLGFFLGTPPFRSEPTFLIALAFFAGYFTRRLAFPEPTDEQATAPDPPPTMFPK